MSSNAASPDALAQQLEQVVGAANVLTDPDLTASYTTDWTRRYHSSARLVVRPGSTEEVAAIVRICHEARIAIVPQGGNTGLVGGSIPHANEVVLSLTRLDAITDLDPVASQLTAGAGATIAAVQEAAQAAGLAYGIDLASRGSATVGGTIATNAGGIRVIRYGATRAQVLGLEAVMANGAVVSRMAGLRKDNSGYDLAGLLTGSEGTLGIVTRAVLKLVPHTPERATALLALDSAADALLVLARVRDAVPGLAAAEVFFAEGVALVCEHTGVNPPFAASYPCYLLVESAGRDDQTESLALALADAPEIRDSAFGVERAQQQALWHYREAHTEAINTAGVPHKLDVTLPFSRFAEFESVVRARIAETDANARPVLFGHIGDGNLHVNILGLAEEDERVDDAVLRLVAEMGGSISSEHGIGVAKAAWLHLTRSPADIAAMRAIKQALDPNGILNPGVIFPPDA